MNYGERHAIKGSMSPDLFQTEARDKMNDQSVRKNVIQVRLSDAEDSAIEQAASVTDCGKCQTFRSCIPVEPNLLGALLEYGADGPHVSPQRTLGDGLLELARLGLREVMASEGGVSRAYLATLSLEAIAQEYLAFSEATSQAVGARTTANNAPQFYLAKAQPGTLAHRMGFSDGAIVCPANWKLGEFDLFEQI